MDDIYAIRRRNLNAALAYPKVARLDREQDKAHLLGVSASMFSQFKNPEYKLGDATARRVESALGLEAGWMDNDHARASHAVGLDPAKLASSIETLRDAFKQHGHTLDPVADAELIAMTYDYLQTSPGNVVEMKGFVKGLVGGRNVGRSEVGVVGEAPVGKAQRRRAS